MRRGISGLLCRGGLVAVGLVAAALLVPGTAGAVLPNPACGSTIYKSVKLHSNMNCSMSDTDGLVVGRSGITVNLNGFKLIGSGTYPPFTDGINNTGGFNHVTVTNGTVSGFWEDVAFSYAKRMNISDVSADNSPHAGFDVENSSDGTITGSEASGDVNYGVAFEQNNNVTLSSSDISGNSNYGVDDYGSLDTLTGDTFNDNGGLGVYVESPLTVSSSTGQLYYSILNSTSSYNGGDGFYIDFNAPATLYQAKLIGNTAEFNGTSGTGWGYYAYAPAKGKNNGARGNASGNCFHVPCHNLSP